MSSTGRAPQPPDAPADSHDSTVVMVTGLSLPSRVAGSVASRYPTAQVVSIEEFTPPHPDAASTVIFIGDDLRDAWEVATSSDGSATSHVRLAFLTASAVGLDALRGYHLESLQPAGDCLIIDLRRTEGIGDAAGWLSKVIGSGKPPVAARPEPATPKGSRTPAARTGVLGGLPRLLRRSWTGVLLLVVVAILCGIVGGLAFASAWVGVFLAGFTVILLTQLGLAVITYRAAAAARKATQAAAKAQQDVAADVRLITASSAETTLLMREQVRGETPTA